MHKLKRFYLLGSLVVSICIPFITFTEYVEATPFVETISELSNKETSEAAIAQTSWKDDLPTVLWSLYFLGLAVFGIRFIKNLSQLLSKIRTNPKLKDQYFTNVLLRDKINPHTFFKYIFLNKYKFECNMIPKEVLLHEQTHAKQLHALDILCIEVVQIVLWFNPLIYILKKDVKLNHEFLADQSVIKEGVIPSEYQNLLLAFSSNATEPQLANAINYSLIKKRFTVMKTRTTKKSAWIKSLILVPLLAFMVYGFSSTKEVIKDPNIVEPSHENRATISKATKEQINTYNALAKKYNKQPEATRTIPLNDLKKLEDIYRVMSSVQKVDAEPFPNCPNQKSATREQMAEYNKLATYYNKMLNDGGRMRVMLSDVERMKYIYSIMSDKQRKDAEPFPDFPEPPPAPGSDVPPPPPIPDNATKEQKVKYKKATDKYYKERKEKARMVKGELAEVPPPPPPPVPENATKEQKVKYEKAKEKYYKEKRVKEEKMAKNEQRIARIKEEKAMHVKQKRAEKIALKERKAAEVKEKRRRVKQKQSRIAEVPEPPKSTLDHVIDMAKKEASFYLEGKKVSSDEAIDAIKKNKSLNVQTIKQHNGVPIVKISKKPIVIKTDN